MNIWERETERTDDDRITETFTRRETPAQRRARIAKKSIDPATERALRAAFNLEG
jgi:hypothetical protein